MMARLILWWRMLVLRAEIAGFDQDIETLRQLDMAGGKTERIIRELQDDARHQLYLCARQALQLNQESKKA